MQRIVNFLKALPCAAGEMESPTKNNLRKRRCQMNTAKTLSFFKVCKTTTHLMQNYHYSAT